MASATAAVAAPGVALPRSMPPRQAKRSSQRQATPSLRPPSAGALSPRRLLSLRVRGRVWIGIVAFALMGIITAQLVVLRLNTSIGQSLARASALSRENASMAITNSEAGSGEAIEAQARGLGMVAVTPGELQFLPAASLGSAQAAAQALRATKASSSAGTLSGGSATSFITPSSGETALTQLPSTGGEDQPGQGAPTSTSATSAETPAEGASTTTSTQAPTGVSDTSSSSGEVPGSTGEAPGSSGEVPGSTGVSQPPAGVTTMQGEGQAASVGGGTQAGAEG